MKELPGLFLMISSSTTICEAYTQRHFNAYIRKIRRFKPEFTRNQTLESQTRAKVERTLS